MLKNFLGRSVVKEAGANPDFDGQMTEVRLWAGERSADEIQDNLFQRLTGQESGLLALWNFADGTARDASPHGRNGTLGGNARITESTLPTAAAQPPWSRLLVQVTDIAGGSVPNVNVRALVDGVEVGRATGDGQGNAPFSVWTAASVVDLVASSTNDLGDWQFAVPIAHYAERTNVWKLGRALHVAGRAVALDGKTPQANLVVELVKVNEASSSRGNEASSSTLNSQPSTPNSSQRLLPSAATNRVLRLDGKGSYVELPTNLLAGTSEVTYEAWLKWERFGKNPVAFVIGAPSRNLAFLIGNDNKEYFSVGDVSNGFPGADLHSPETIELHQWVHAAGVVSTNGMRLYLNGVLVSTNSYSERPFNDGEVQQAALGHVSFISLDDLQGEMDEVRLWKAARTADEIRADMLTKLTGREPGLVGIWNFDDPANPGKDSSGHGADGKLVGQAQTVVETLPLVVTGRITDGSGRGLTNAYVEVRRADGVVSRAPANAAGDYAFTIQPSERTDLFATDGEHSAFRLGFQPSGEREQRLDWALTGTGVDAGSAPSKVGRDVPIAPQRRAEDSPPYLPSATNRVLQLDGKGYFELPPNIFDELTEATVEGWVRWSKADRWNFIFFYGKASWFNFSINLSDRNELRAGVYFGSEQNSSHETLVLDFKRPNEWMHFAFVTGTGGQRLFLNGVLVGTNTFTDSFAAAPKGAMNFLGHLSGSGAEDLQGQIDEFRVWKTRRTAEEIRENLHVRLTGRSRTWRASGISMIPRIPDATLRPPRITASWLARRRRPTRRCP